MTRDSSGHGSGRPGHSHGPSYGDRDRGGHGLHQAEEFALKNETTRHVTHPPAHAAVDDAAILGRIEDLEAILAEKDHVVTALTVQLEEAAERIDRMQRMGHDRGPRSGGGGVPLEMIEEQKNIADNVQRFVLQWEESQPTAALARIEMQLSELRDLVVQSQESTHGGAVVEPKSDAGAGSTLAGWEAMKANLLAGSAEEGEADSEDPPMEDDEAIQLSTVAPPVPVEDGSSDVDLRNAVAERDNYILWLQQSVRQAELRRRKALALAGDTPEPLQHRLEELEHVYQEQRRLAEVEMSLERARLGREEMRLRQLEDVLQRELKRLGVQNAGGGKPSEAECPKNRRWRRILGIVKPEGE